MADIRKRIGIKGTTYQVRYPSKATKSGYVFKTFETLKEAKAYVEGGETRKHPTASHHEGIRTVSEATDLWLKICEKEGLNGREPVTSYTLANYQYRAEFIKAYPWRNSLRELTAPDIVAFRSWLLSGETSRVVASKVLSSFQSVMKEMTIRGALPHNVATGIYIRADSRYSEPVVIPSRADIKNLLAAADRLANSKNIQIARTWERYRPILYLAVDSGMRPQEYLAVAKSAFDNYGVQVTRAIDGGGHALTVTKTPSGRRYIELSPHTLDLVNHYANHHAAPNDYDLVFSASNGRWLCRKNWQRRGFNIACLEAGLVEIKEENGNRVERPKFRPYDLRHFFASMLIEKKTNLKKIQTLMGHANIETTLNVYGHLLEDAAEDNKIPGGLLFDMLDDSHRQAVVRIT